MESYKVPFSYFDREANVLLFEGLLDDIKGVIESGRYLFGPLSIKLEEKLSSLFKSQAVLVGSGTDAIALSLKALGIGPGDKVAVPMISAMPTAIAVKMIGADAAYIDVDESFTMSPIKLIQAIKQDYSIKAVLPVHLYGNVANIDYINEICQKFNLYLVEDCAQSFGAKTVTNGRMLGTIGISGALSFYPTKNLGSMGDSGCVITSEIDFANDIKQLRFYGQKSKSKIGERYGMNSRTDEIQCAILLKKLERIHICADNRKKLKKLYDKHLNVRTIDWKDGALPHLYPIRVGADVRDDFIKSVNKKGVELGSHYPFHLQEAIEKTPGVGRNTLAGRYVKEIVSIPFNPWITHIEAEYVIMAINDSIKEVMK
jgi:dTDP-4-amino-4,6-dideoxygalactose transaminase